MWEGPLTWRAKCLLPVPVHGPQNVALFNSRFTKLVEVIRNPQSQRQIPPVVRAGFESGSFVSKYDHCSSMLRIPQEVRLWFVLVIKSDNWYVTITGMEICRPRESFAWESAISCLNGLQNPTKGRHNNSLRWICCIWLPWEGIIGRPATSCLVSFTAW